MRMIGNLLLSSIPSSHRLFQVGPPNPIFWLFRTIQTIWGSWTMLANFFIIQNHHINQHECICSLPYSRYIICLFIAFWEILSTRASRFAEAPPSGGSTKCTVYSVLFFSLERWSHVQREAIYIQYIYIYRYDVCAYCAYVYMWLHFFCMFFLGGRDRWCNILGVCYCPNSWVTSWPCQPFLWCPRIVGQEIPSTWRRLPWQWPNDLGNGLGVDVESILNQSSRWEFKIVHVRVLTLDRFSTVTFFFPHLCGIFVGGLHKFAWPLCSISWSWLHHITIIYYLSIVHHLLSSKAPSLDARMMLRMMPGV